MKRIILTLLAILFSVQIFSGAYASEFRIVVVVGSRAISSHDIDNRYKLALFASGLTPSKEMRERLLPQITQVLINEALYHEEAKRLGYELNKIEVARAMRHIEQKNGLKPGKLDEFLASKGIPYKAVQDQVEAELLWEKIIARKVRPAIVITEKDVDEGVEHLIQNIGLSEVNLSEIVLPIENPKNEPEVRKLADKLISEINNGADFASVARQFSQSITASSGGLIGWVQQNQLAPDIASNIRLLDAGQITAPLRTLEGYQILKINDKRSTGSLGHQPSTYTIRKAFIPFAEGLSEKEKVSFSNSLNEARKSIKKCEQFGDFAKAYHSTISSDPVTMQLNELKPQVASAIKNTALGKTSSIVRSNDGLHVLMVCDKENAKLTDEQRNRVRESLYQQQLSLGTKRYLQTIRRNTFIEIRD